MKLVKISILGSALVVCVASAAWYYQSHLQKNKKSLADSGQSCAAYHSGLNSAFENATCLLSSGKNIEPGESFEGYAQSYAVYPATCGEKQKTTCLKGGTLQGRSQLYSSCQQMCVDPDSGQVVEANQKIYTYAIQTGTKQQCKESRQYQTCDANTGLLVSESKISEKKYSSCTVLVAEEAEVLRWSDPKTWGGALPQAGASLVIPENKIIILDINPPALGSIEIQGILTFDNKDLSLAASLIVIKGSLQIGSPSAPFKHEATIQIVKNLNSPQSGLRLQGGQLDIHGLDFEHTGRGPASFNWGLTQFKNISLKNENQ